MNARLSAYIGLFIVLALFFGYIKPTYSGSIVKLNQSISAKNKEIISATKYAEKQAELGKQYISVSKEGIAKLNQMIPNTNSNVQLILDLNSLASQSGFYITSFDVSKNNSYQRRNQTAGKPTKNTYKITKLTVSGSGSYDSFRQFINGAERSLRLIDITNISIKSNNITGMKVKTSETFSYKITMDVYWLPPVTQVFTKS